MTIEEAWERLESAMDDYWFSRRSTQASSAIIEQVKAAALAYAKACGYEPPAVRCFVCGDNTWDKGFV